MWRAVPFVLCLVMLLCACGGSGGTTSSRAVSTTGVPPTAPETATGADDAGDGCADVVAVEAIPGPSGWTFSVTVASADTGWDKYADAWVVRTEDGDVLAERILTHPHVDEQPFTRSQSGIEIPGEVTSVVVAARDSVAGFCGAEMTVSIAGDAG